MPEENPGPEAVEAVEAAALEHGTYEIVRERLRSAATELADRAQALNQERLALFGGVGYSVIGSERIRTENNCIPRDIVAVGDHLVFGYNVFIGLRHETRVRDVLSLHHFERTPTPDGGGAALSFRPHSEDSSTFVDDPRFVADFQELFQYYKSAELTQLRHKQGKLLAVVKTGEGKTDHKVFRWSVADSGEVAYIDNRGERDHDFPPSHDFEWQLTTREDHVDGRHPHVSILDQVFVEATGGKLTVKVEDNTEDGQGVWSEPVDDPNQSLEDADIRYAKVGVLILLSVLPYRETERRYLVFNTRTSEVTRIDAIGQACVELPSDHGIVFPGGIYLQSGAQRTFDGDVEGMKFTRRLRSPNGEDVLFVFYEGNEGRYALLPYNTIRREVQSPIHCHGYSLFEDGRMVVFRAEAGEEASRVHTMQIWQTPFVSEEQAADRASTGSFLETVGNGELVRAISDAFSLKRAVEIDEPSRAHYEDLIASAGRMLDDYHWLDRDEVGNPAAGVRALLETAELVIDEFEKVESLRAQAEAALRAAEESLDALFSSSSPGLSPGNWETVDLYVQALAELRRKRGELVGLREMRYVRTARVAELDAQVAERFDALSDAAVSYLTRDDALASYATRIEEVVAGATGVESVVDAAPLLQALEQVNAELEVLTEVMGSLEIEDSTKRTQILEGVSEIYGQHNRAKAIVEARRKELLSTEGQAEFAVQFKLFGQAVTSALALASAPERCDDQLSRLMLQLEELESRFSEFDRFLDELATKREDVYEAFSARKQALVDEREQRATHTAGAANRVLDGITRRASSFSDEEDLNAYFASDPMVHKLRDLAERLRALEAPVRADELESRLKAAREEASRSLRDRQDLYEDGNAVIVLGRHRFSVNRQPLDVTTVPQDGELILQLTGTDFRLPVASLAGGSGIEETREYWDQLLISETRDVYRSEYLAASLLFDAEAGTEGASLAALRESALSHGVLLERVRAYAAARYDEGYERGVHDEDATRILASLLHLHHAAGLLRFAPEARAFACLFWAHYDDRTLRPLLSRRAASLARLRDTFSGSRAIETFCDELAAPLSHWFVEQGRELPEKTARAAARYLFEEIAGGSQAFVASREADDLARALQERLSATGQERELDEDLRALERYPLARFELAESWLTGLLDGTEDPDLATLRPALPEAAALQATERKLSHSVSGAQLVARVEGLLGQHARIETGCLALRLDEFLGRLGDFQQQRVPGFRAYQASRGALLESARGELRLSEFKPRVMSAFVRNQLIDQVYLPVIGDNLAKQMGALGDAKRTDQMGLLLLISPPGYGKTTLMEYVADRLGLAFVKVNGPALGHGVTSLDPAAAPNAAARQEVEKINLAFEMGNNALLYLDDIQHTNPELLQKFISLCDAQRKVEGVWRGKTRTYDLRGKRFAVCMAGNPYTESGEKFQIPDMLANRADIYNLGDVLSGREDLFALSYVENSLTSNPVLSRLTGHDLGDVEKLVRMARGESIPPDALSHAWSRVELEEILQLLRKLLRVQEVLLAVNTEYIRSASMDDAYRLEPPFKLQGSYRNMNKLAEKLVPVMNDAELERLIDDHYQGESQTLTTGAEQNILKLAELRGVMSDEQRTRWEQIKRDFQRTKSLGGDEDDPVTRVTAQLSLVGQRLEEIGEVIHKASDEPTGLEARDLSEVLLPPLERIAGGLAELGERSLALDMSAVAPSPEVPAAQPLMAGLEGISERLAQIGDSISIASGASAMPDLTELFEGLERSLREVVRPAESLAPVQMSGSEVLAPYLERLDTTLRAVVSAPRGGEVVQALGPGVKELIEKMLISIGDGLLPLLRAIERRAHLGEQDHRLKAQMNRTLKNFDMLRDLLEALKKLDTRELLRRQRGLSNGPSHSTSAKPTRDAEE